jgi:hypothetical protein
LVNIDCRKSNLKTYFSLEVYVALSVASLHWDFTCRNFNLQTHLRLDVNVALLVTKFIIMCYNNSTDLTGDCDERWLHFWRQSINCMPHQQCTLHSRLWCERVHNLIYFSVSHPCLTAHHATWENPSYRFLSNYGESSTQISKQLYKITVIEKLTMERATCDQIVDNLTQSSKLKSHQNTSHNSYNCCWEQNSAPFFLYWQLSNSYSSQRETWQWSHRQEGGKWPTGIV